MTSFFAAGVCERYRHDHCPLLKPNPYQLGIDEVKDSLANCRIWAKGMDYHDSLQLRRREELSRTLGRELPNVEGVKEASFEFSGPVPHGKGGNQAHSVMMSRIEEDGQVFVHASDIQFLDRNTIGKIKSWKPNVVFVSGPPLYRYEGGRNSEKEEALKNTADLSDYAATLIIDHHLLRSEEGMEWLGELKRSQHGEVLCAADYMGRQPVLLEAWREELYEWLPVPEGWHEGYRQKAVDAGQYRSEGWKMLVAKKKIEPCRWYYSCPIRIFTERGQLESHWIENYCLVGNKRCVRYRMEEMGEYHPDNMLPNGEIREGLR